jgi:hypothetical protein
MSGVASAVADASSSLVPSAVDPDQPVRNHISSVLSKLLPATVAPTVGGPLHRRAQSLRGRPPVDPSVPSKYMLAKQQRLAAEAEAKAAIAAVVAKVQADNAAASGAAPLKRGRGRPRKYAPLPNMSQIAPLLASVAVPPTPVVSASEPATAPAPTPAAAATAATSDEPATTAGQKRDHSDVAATPLGATVADASAAVAPPRSRGRPRKVIAAPTAATPSPTVAAAETASDCADTAHNNVGAIGVAPTTVIVLPREVTYAGLRLLNVARNRQLLAQLSLTRHTPSESAAPVKRSAAALTADAAAAAAATAPSVPPAAKRSRSAVPVSDELRPLQRSAAKRKATCGNASCSGFCGRCLATAPRSEMVSLAIETPPSLPRAVNRIHILAPSEGEELDKGSTVRVVWKASSLQLLHGVARWGYVMLVQVTSGKRAIDDYYFPLVYRPGLLSAHTRVAAADADDLPDVPKDGSGRPLPVSGGTGRGRRPKLPTGKRRAQGGATPAFDSDGDQDVAVAHVTGAVYQEDEATLTATLDWTCPWDLEAGEYVIEVGLMRRLSTSFARSEKLIVVGAYADLVLCLCGDTQHREDEERASSYVRCKVCKCWSHIQCVERWWREDSDVDFECPFCLAPAMSAIDEASSLVCHLLSMMSSFSGRYSFQGDKLARTPPKVVRFLQSIVRQHRPPTPRCNVLELGAGEGHIAVSLVTDDLFADHANCFVERVPERVVVGHAKCVTARARDPEMPPLNSERFECSHGALDFKDGWCTADYTALPFLQWLLAKDADGRRLHTFDVVLSNPDFNVGMQTIYIALLALAPASDDNPMPLLFLILPTDFFEASEQRMRIFRMLGVRIVSEYKLGHQSYYVHQYQEKRNCDSLFVVARPRAGAPDAERFQHMVYDVRLQGLV